MDSHRRQEARNRLIADQQGDHRQHDSAAEARQIAQLAGTEYEPAVADVTPRIGVGQGRYQHGPGVSRHVQAIGHQRQRTEQPAADDLNHHHHAAQSNDTPGLALVLFVARAQEGVVMPIRKRGIVNAFHGGSLI